MGRVHLMRALVFGYILVLSPKIVFKQTVISLILKLTNKLNSRLFGGEWVYPYPSLFSSPWY